jgi:hypothetical protein|tara:strand:+ start:578 stop:760 length:183 start_codon:yes stop_codon:yes gene_type:complete
MIKNILLISIATLALLSIGCKCTATVGKTANPPWFNAKADKAGAGVTLPLVKVGAEWADE